MGSVDEIWLVDFGDGSHGEPSSRRPALIIGPPPTFGTSLPMVIVVPLTTTARDLSIHVEIEPSEANGLDQTSHAQCELIRSIRRGRLVHKLGVVDPSSGATVADITRMLLDH